MQKSRVRGLCFLMPLQQGKQYAVFTSPISGYQTDQIQEWIRLSKWVPNTCKDKSLKKKFKHSVTGNGLFESHIHLPHAAWLQVTARLLASSGQGAPPLAGGGLVQVRVSISNPLPQVTEQGVVVVHGENPPSTGPVGPNVTGMCWFELGMGWINRLIN